MRRLKAWWARRVNRDSDPAWRLYRAVASQATAGAVFRRYALDDTPETRFELLALHMAAAWARMNAGSDEVRRLRQGMGDAFVADMDASLRDLGAGDLGVGKRVKALAERLYGRLPAYAEAFAPDAADETIEAALARNLFKDGGSPAPDAIAATRALGQAWREHDNAAIAQGEAPTLPEEGI